MKTKSYGKGKVKDETEFIESYLSSELLKNSVHPVTSQESDETKNDWKPETCHFQLGDYFSNFCLDNHFPDFRLG